MATKSTRRHKNVCAFNTTLHDAARFFFAHIGNAKAGIISVLPVVPSSEYLFTAMSCKNWVLLVISISAGLLLPSPLFAELRVGATVVDVTPTQMPVLVNGGMVSRSADKIKTRVNARAVVLDDGDDKIAIVVVDSCMMPRLLLDDAKARASKATGIPAENMLISATHTHTAPSSFGALGTDADLTYLPLLRERLVQAITEANGRLRAARVGWGSVNVPEMTALRRWVRRPDKVDIDPFGNETVRANMHSARNKADVTGPSGPEDPELSIISFQTKDGVPIAVLANYSMHYFGDSPISADYFGLFSDSIAQHAVASYKKSDVSEGNVPSVVGILSHGCSGDIWRRDYWTFTGKDDTTIDAYAQKLAGIAATTYDSIEYEDVDDIAMTQFDLPMNYRVPDAQRLQWAKQIVSEMGDRNPKDRDEVYAREQVLLHEAQSTNIIVQALKIGDIAIATTPNETYALTGLKLKLQSPFDKTMVIELANGADGYIPPPEQHPLGGYNTWAARSAGLEVMAESRIVAAGLAGLEKVAGKSRRPFRQSVGDKAQSILDSDPALYWRMDQLQIEPTADVSGNGRDGTIESDAVYFLPGPEDGWTDGEPNRCIHFAGGRIHRRTDGMGGQWTASISLWNGMPNDARGTTGWFASIDHNHSITPAGLHFGISGTDGEPGKLVLQQGLEKRTLGKTTLDRWVWYRVAVVCDNEEISVFLNGNSEPEIQVPHIASTPNAPIQSFFIGGRSDNQDNWQGRLDEFALWTRALPVKDLK